MTTHDDDLTAAVRDLVRLVHGVEPDAGAVAEALRHLRAAADVLRGGEPRRRWYEVGAAGSGVTRSRNRELSPFSGARNPLAPPMVIEPGETVDGRPAMVGRVRFDRLREGPPHSVHGGVLAGCFDELLGAAQRLTGGTPGMTGRLTVRYRRPTPLDADLELRAWVHDERRRRVTLRAECRLVPDPGSAATPVTAEAEGVFLRVDFAGLDAMMRERVDGVAPPPAPPNRSTPDATAP